MHLDITLQSITCTATSDRNPSQLYTYYRKAVPTGMLSGAMGQFLASPTDLVKTRLQMEGRRLLDGYKPRLVSMAVSFSLLYVVV